MTDEQLEKRLKVLSVITRVHHMLNPLVEEVPLARMLIREIVSIVPCEGCIVMLVDGTNGKVLAVKGTLRAFPGMPLNLPELILSLCVRGFQSIFTGENDSIALALSEISASPVNSVICCPIWVKDSVQAIILTTSGRKNAFSREDLQLVEMLARQVSMALEVALTLPSHTFTSIRDSLTGLFNRRKYEIDIEAEVAWAERFNRALSVMMVDIDHFSIYNKVHGKEKGDAVLKDLGYTLYSSVRALDGVYRYGGEEFTIVLPNTTIEHATTVGTRILHSVEETKFNGEEISQPGKILSVSIGIASFSLNMESPMDLTKAAEEALTKAKLNGRNQVQLL